MAFSIVFSNRVNVNGRRTWMILRVRMPFANKYASVAGGLKLFLNIAVRKCRINNTSRYGPFCRARARHPVYPNVIVVND